MTKDRIELNDSIFDIMGKMADGNPGAITVIMEIMEKVAGIDPQGAMGGIGPILSLDTHGIYGTDIYILWNDKCDRDLRKFLMLLRSVQLGLFSHVKLKEMADDQMRKVNLTKEEMNNLDDQVCEQLKDFKKRE